MDKSDGEWKQTLTPEQFRSLRRKATEAPFSGEYDDFYKPGDYACAACGAILFESDTKFDAACGWPSFYDAKPGSVKFTSDETHGMTRVEVTCANCGGHLGHVFEGEGFDTPTDKRYCINSVSLAFQGK
ncbi:MAG: peptide-methionine (R)-S-oxide reductase MsrB [Candidatus Saccharimonas sp.]